MTVIDRNPIAALLGVQPPRDKLAFTFDGRRFELYPAREGTWETLYTCWADGSRDVAATGSMQDFDIQVANLLAHKFRRGLNRIEASAVLDRARATLASVPA